jgi:hypothetical protein
MTGVGVAIGGISRLRNQRAAAKLPCDWKTDAFSPWRRSQKSLKLGTERKNCCPGYWHVFRKGVVCESWLRMTSFNRDAIPNLEDYRARAAAPKSPWSTTEEALRELRVAEGD